MLLNTEVNFVQILNEYILSASNYWLCQLQRLIVLVPIEIAHDTVIVKNVLGIIRKRMNGLTARDRTDMVKPSEIEYQNGTVVRLGEQCGVHTPVNKFVYECILPMERRARNKGKGR